MIFDNLAIYCDWLMDQGIECDLLQAQSVPLIPIPLTYPFDLLSDYLDFHSEGDGVGRGWFTDERGGNVPLGCVFEDKYGSGENYNNGGGEWSYFFGNGVGHGGA
jgi:hypothetical protein